MLGYSYYSCKKRRERILLLGERERVHHYVTVLMAFLYVRVVIPYCSNSKLHDNFGKMQTHARPRMPSIILVVVSLSSLLQNYTRMYSATLHISVQEIPNHEYRCSDIHNLYFQQSLPKHKT